MIDEYYLSLGKEVDFKTGKAKRTHKYQKAFFKIILFKLSKINDKEFSKQPRENIL